MPGTKRHFEKGKKTFYQDTLALLAALDLKQSFLSVGKFKRFSESEKIKSRFLPTLEETPRN